MEQAGQAGVHGGFLAARGPLGDSLSAGLARVEDALHACAVSDSPFVAEAAAHLMTAGGKRFRPVLALLAAQLGDPDSDDVVAAAVVCELTHLATLYHDDVMDEAAVRRGAPSANSRWSNSIAILTGDFLFARASDLLADLGPEAVRVQARTFERLVTGQIRETVGPVEGEDPIEHHLSVLADKTGSLVATSARFGATFAGVDREVVEDLTAYAEEIGVAFQLADDLIDIVSDGGTSGSRRAPTCARASPRCRCCSSAPATTRPRPGCASWSRARSPTTPSTPRPWRCCAAPSLARATEVLHSYADRPGHDWAGCPRARSARRCPPLCDYVVTRSA